MKTLVLLAALLCAPTLFAQGGSCDSGNNGTAIITLSASGTTQIVAPVAGVSLHICTVSIGFASAVNVTLVKTNTGGNANATGTYQNQTLFVQNYNGALRTGLGNGFGINLSSAVTGGGLVTYYLSHTN